MKPKKVKIENFAKSKDKDFFSNRASAAFLLMNMAKVFIDDADEVLRNYGLTIGKIKKTDRTCK